MATKIQHVQETRRRRHHPPQTKAYRGHVLRGVRLDGDAARAIEETAGFATEFGLSMAPWAPFKDDAAAVIRYGLSLVAAKLDAIETDEEAGEFVADLRPFRVQQESQAARKHKAEQAQLNAAGAKTMARKEAERKRLERAEKRLAEEQEEVRFARLKELIAEERAS